MEIPDCQKFIGMMDTKKPFPVRKPNRLKSYDYSAAGMYFITICARNKEKLFGWISDGDLMNPPQMYVSLMGSIVAEQIETIEKARFVSVNQYVVMPNHIHMILLLEDGANESHSAANAVIPHIVGTFKRFCNQRIGENVFQRSFHDHIIRNRMEYEKIWMYIEDNPRRWKEDCFYIE